MFCCFNVGFICCFSPSLKSYFMPLLSKQERMISSLSYNTIIISMTSFSLLSRYSLKTFLSLQIRIASKMDFCVLPYKAICSLHTFVNLYIKTINDLYYKYNHSLYYLNTELNNGTIEKIIKSFSFKGTTPYKNQYYNKTFLYYTNII